MKKYTDYIWTYSVDYYSYGYDGGHMANRTTDDIKEFTAFCKETKDSINKITIRGKLVYDSAVNKPDDIKNILKKEAA